MAMENFSRRDLLKSAVGLTGLVLGFQVGLRTFPFASAATAEAFAPNVYLSIDENGDVTIVAHRSEMGTGIRTGLPMVLADELEADWNRVKVVQAQGDAKYGDQNTDGSRSIRQFYQPMRVAGAAARSVPQMPELPDGAWSVCHRGTVAIAFCSCWSRVTNSAPSCRDNQR